MKTFILSSLIILLTYSETIPETVAINYRHQTPHNRGATSRYHNQQEPIAHHIPERAFSRIRQPIGVRFLPNSPYYRDLQQKEHFIRHHRKESLSEDDDDDTVAGYDADDELDSKSSRKYNGDPSGNWAEEMRGMLRLGDGSKKNDVKN